MLNSCILNAAAAARPVKRIGVAEISVAESAPFPVNPASAMLANAGPRRVPADREHNGQDRERDDQRAHGHDDGQPPGLLEPALEPDHARPPRHQQSDLLDRRGAGLQLAHDLALVDDEDAVRECADLVEVLAEEQDRYAPSGGISQVRVDRLDRTDVEPTRRLRHDEDERIVCEFATEYELLEIAAGQVPGRRLPGRESSRRSDG